MLLPAARHILDKWREEKLEHARLKVESKRLKGNPALDNPAPMA
jgi:hypothetical protein